MNKDFSPCISQKGLFDENNTSFVFLAKFSIGKLINVVILLKKST